MTWDMGITKIEIDAQTFLQKMSDVGAKSLLLVKWKTSVNVAKVQVWFKTMFNKKNFYLGNIFF